MFENSGFRCLNQNRPLLFDREKIIRFAAAYDTSAKIKIQLEDESEDSVCSVSNLRCVGSAIQVYHGGKIQLYRDGIYNNEKGQIYTLTLEPTQPTLPTQYYGEQSSAAQQSTKTHLLEPTLYTLLTPSIVPQCGTM